MTSPYRMTLSLAVLDDLGINLYSSAPAVLSEVVANAWDADADRVDISLMGTEVVVEDNGHGMNLADINYRLLTVGYKRRAEGRTSTPRYGRPVMGRKGIGKLSLFAIADEVLIETCDGNEKHALVLRTSDIRVAIERDETYNPEPADPSSIDFEQGTRITLSALKHVIDGRTRTPLVRRLARRFSVIGAAQDFEVFVDREQIGVADRGYWGHVQFVWVLGDPGDDPLTHSTPNRSDRIDGDAGAGREVSGWIGSVYKPKQLDPEGPGLPVLARGKLVHEDLLAHVPHSGLFTKYLVGEIHAEFVDIDDEPDIATTDRQHLKESDERFEALKQYLSSALSKIEVQWTDWRRADAAKRAAQYPAIKQWLDSLEGDSRRAAEQLFGRIGSLEVEREDERKELYKYAILAFERLRLNDMLSALDRLGGDELEETLKVFGRLDDIEAVLYGEIARGRLRVIKEFQDLVDEDAKEKTIQRYLAEHLWLLHPAWERPTENPRMEQRVEAVLEMETESLTDEERAGRLDLFYRSAAGTHVIIELKRYSARVTSDQLYKQLNKYLSATEKVLTEHAPGEEQVIKIYVIVGTAPSDAPPERVAAMLDSVKAQLLTYDQLIEEALERYGDYIAANKKLSDLEMLLTQLENEEPVEEDD